MAPGVAVIVGAPLQAASTKRRGTTELAFFTRSIVSASLLNPARALVLDLRQLLDAQQVGLDGDELGSKPPMLGTLS
jgi:hypothetical protein